MNKKRVERAALYALLFSYMLIIIPIFLSHYNLVNLSFKWLFLPFILTGLFFYLFRIDSRYLVLPAILLLWLCPFLLIYGREKTAEATAIYVFYFLVISVILQFTEFKFNYKDNIKFELVKKFLFNKKILYFSIFFAILFIFTYFFNLANLSKAVSLYMGVTLLIIFHIQYFISF